MTVIELNPGRVKHEPEDFSRKNYKSCGVGAERQRVCVQQREEPEV